MTPTQDRGVGRETRTYRMVGYIFHAHTFRSITIGSGYLYQ